MTRFCDWVAGACAGLGVLTMAVGVAAVPQTAMAAIVAPCGGTCDAKINATKDGCDATDSCTGTDCGCSVTGNYGSDGKLKSCKGACNVNTAVVVAE